MSVTYFIMIFLATWVIKGACDAYEQSASYLGRNMGAGSRGALLDAIGSSLPELFVTLMFVISGKPEVILAGIGVTAGSAIFNAVVIPAFSILFAHDEDGNKVEHFSLDRKVLLRDGIGVLLAEWLLIEMLGYTEFTLGMGFLLIAFYALYAGKVMWDSKQFGDDEPEDYEFESLESKNFLKALIAFDFNYIIFGDKTPTTKSAWTNLILSVSTIGFACHYLAIGIEGTAGVLGVDIYITAVLLGAAATSVPDTILSCMSAKRGDYDDAVANAVGSNIFDVTMSLGLPLVGYMLWSGKNIPLAQSGDLTALRILVLGITAAVIGLLYWRADRIDRKVAYALFGMYAGFVGYILYSI